MIEVANVFQERAFQYGGQNGFVSNPELVTALDLDQWSGNLAAPTTLPMLVRRLILATASASVTEITMRAREGALLPGWDGIVRSDAADPHVPLGTSGWELGTSKDPRGKAQDDIRHRTKDPLVLDPRTTTFVAVTSRFWRDRDAWCDARRKDGPWADVRAYDADDLVTWLERAPSVRYWISEQLGREPRGVRTPDTWWDRWVSQTRVVLPRGFLLAGRDEVITRIRDALAKPPLPITVVAPSREEALAIVCASVLGDGEDVDTLRARAVIVSAPGAWDRLVDSAHGLVLIPDFDDADIASALSKGHHVVIPLGRDARHAEGHIVVPLIDREKATEALIDDAAAITRDVAGRYAGHAHRNLLSLRRTLAINPKFERPPWSQGEEGRRLAPLVLAGSWSDDVDGDREVIEALTGRPYTEVEGDLAIWSTLDDAPLIRTGQVWRVVSKEDAWDLVSSLITKTDLKRFHEVAPRVMEEHDPALDLPAERRFMASVVGEPRTYSPRLRQGIADTVAFLGGYATDQRLKDGATGELHALRVVRAVTEHANADPTGRAWQSLADVLPLLAEASPDAFLDAVDAGLAGDAPLLRSLFLDSELGPTFGTSSPHIRLLWALESLAWSSAHMSRAAGALARLAKIDPEPNANIHPRPAGSLADVFNLYHPQTSVPLARRLDVLDGQRRRSPAEAWRLLRSILPTRLTILSPSYRPRWRPWALAQPETITYGELFDGISRVVTWVIEDAGKDPGRWHDLVSHIEVLPSEDRDRLLAAFEALDPDSLGDPGRHEVWRALVDLGATHRQFPDAGWAMPGDVVDRVEAVAAHFAPTSPVDLSVDLFGHRPRLPGIAPLDHSRYDAALPPARQAAARAVLDSEGIAGLLRLGAAAKLPMAVGWTAAEARGDDLADDLLALLGTGGSDGWVAHGYAAGRIEAEGLDWLVRQLRRWPDGESIPQQAGLLLAVPRPNEAHVTIVDGLHPDVRAAFWRGVNTFAVHPDARPVVARKLIEHRRPWGAIDLLVTMLHALGGSVAPDVDLVESVLMSAATGPADDAPRAASLSWEVGELLDYLERTDSDIQTRARLEFFYAHLLQHTRAARALNEVLGTAPALFAEILSHIYFAEDEPRDEEVSPERRAIAEVGNTVIRSWHTPPGVRPDGTVDAEDLRAWVTESRRLLAESGRSTIGDIVIGEVLAHVPPDGDGLWPAHPVRDLIEDLASQQIEKGVLTGKFNSRGLVTRSLAGGGAPERQLAAQYRAWADQVSDRWPRTGALLRQMAANYEEWAHREDDQSEHFGDDGT
jgi:hypothetical protein